jgi:hypothetical protein
MILPLSNNQVPQNPDSIINGRSVENDMRQDKKRIESNLEVNKNELKADKPPTATFGRVSTII